MIPVNIEDGTMYRAPSPTPGTVGTTVLERGFAQVTGAFSKYAAATYEYYDSAKSLYLAYRRCVQLVPTAMYHETGYQLGAVL